MIKKTDLAIIGGGIAGVSAAVYARRAGLDFTLFEGGSIGGQIMLMESVDNYVGVDVGTKSADLIGKLSATLDALDIIPVSENVSRIVIRNNAAALYSDNATYEARCVILAAGASFKQLGAKGEKEFAGRGVSYCAVCDGYFFRDKDVAVIGGGNTAVEEALYLANICRKVYLVHRRDKLRAMDYLQKELAAKPNVEIIYNSSVDQIKGADFVEGILLTDAVACKTRMVAVSGVFVAVGVLPSSGLVKDLVKLDEQGFILTDDGLKTSCGLVWACGDCRKRPLRQLITAASEGALAALGAYHYLQGDYISA